MDFFRTGKIFLTATIYLTGLAHAGWTIPAAPTVTEPSHDSGQCSIERDGKGKFIIAYIERGSYPNYDKSIKLKYHNGTQWTTSAAVLSTTDFYSGHPTSFFVSVSLAVRHAVGTASTTNICVAATIRATSTSDEDSVSFTYVEATLSTTGVLTLGDPELMTSDEGVGGPGNPNALRWFDTDSCHAQPSPENNRYYADGTNDIYYANASGMVRVAYSGDTLWLGCAVSGFVDHTDTDSPDPANVTGYRYEEHQALYLFEETDAQGGGVEWTHHTNGGDMFEFETCEIVNSDFVPLPPNTNFHLAADHQATTGDTWVLSYQEIDYTGSNDSISWVVDDDITPTRREVRGVLDWCCEEGQGPERAPFVVVWDGNPYLVYNEWYEWDEDLCGYTTPPCPYRGGILVEPVDNSPTSGLGVGFLSGVCNLSPAGVFLNSTVKYVGISADGVELSIMQGWAGYDTFVGDYKIDGVPGVGFGPGHSSVTYVKEAIEYGRAFFGDRVAVKTDGKRAMLLEVGEEDRHAEIEYEYVVVEEP